MGAVKRGFYPVVIQETRYSGAYSGGQWALIAGVYDPDAHTEAFGGDGPCHSFWLNAQRDGPVLTIDDPYRDGERDIYVASGDDPNALVNDFVAFDADP